MSNSRQTLDDSTRESIRTKLQQVLVDLVNLALAGKQAHWNVRGERFLTVHEQLDTIIDAARTVSDEVAERIVTLGHPADGRAATVAGDSDLPAYPGGFVSVEETLSNYADQMEGTIRSMRNALEGMGELDPISEDLLISSTGELEKLLWMFEAHQLKA